MVAIPVSTHISIIHSKQRYTNRNIKTTAANDNIYAFATALNYLQYGTPAEKYVKIQKSELKDA